MMVVRLIVFILMVLEIYHARKTIIRNNVILNKNQDPLAHNDAIQSVIADGFVIYNNIIVNDSVYSPEGGGMPFILSILLHDFDYNDTPPVIHLIISFRWEGLGKTILMRTVFLQGTMVSDIIPGLKVQICYK